MHCFENSSVPFGKTAFVGTVFVFQPKSDGVPAELSFLPEDALTRLRKVRIAAVAVGDFIAGGKAAGDEAGGNAGALDLTVQICDDVRTADNLVSFLLNSAGKTKKQENADAANANERVINDPPVHPVVVRALEFGPYGLSAWNFRTVSKKGKPSASVTNQNFNEQFRSFLRGSSTVPRPLRQAARLLLSHLDRRILTAMRTSRMLTGDVYDWCLIDPERRSAALLSYPTLGRHFTNRADLSNRCDMAIACGASLEDALVDTAQLPRGAVRALARQNAAPVIAALRKCGLNPYAVTGVQSGTYGGPASVQGMDDYLLAALDATPSHARPRSARAWAAWVNIVIGLGQTPHLGAWTSAARYDRKAREGFIAEDGVRRLLIDTVSNHDWVERWHPENCGILRSRVSDACDVVTDMIRNVLLPAALVHRAANGGVIRNKKAQALERNANNTMDREFSNLRDAVTFALAGRGGIGSLLSLSAAWHERMGNGGTGSMLTPLSDDLPVGQFVTEPIVVDLPFAMAGADRGRAVITPLRTLGEVRKEGTEMGHCLGRMYADQCAAGCVFAYAISVEDASGNPFTRLTASVSWESGSGVDGEGAIHFHDMKGARNVAPESLVGVQAAEEIKACLLRTLEGRKPAGGEEAQRRYRLSRGYDALKKEPETARELAWSAYDGWRPLLPKRLRSSDPIAFLSGPMRGFADMLFDNGLPETKRKAPVDVGDQRAA